MCSNLDIHQMTAPHLISVSHTRLLYIYLPEDVTKRAEDNHHTSRQILNEYTRALKVVFT